MYKRQFDTIVSRAFSSTAQFCAWTEHLLKKGGFWLAMKGLPQAEELAEIERPYRLEQYQVPTLEEERSIILIQK